MKKLIPGLLYTIFFLALACSNKSEGSKQSEVNSNGSNATIIQKVGVVNPVERVFNSEVHITGTAMPYQQVMLMAMESGFVKAMYKDIGDPVVKGEVIAILQNPELTNRLKESEANLKRSEATILQNEAELKKWTAVKGAKKEILDRIESTYKKASNIVLAADVDNARAEYEVSNANLIAAKAGITIAQSNYDAMDATNQGMKARVNMLRIKAPFSGLITQRFVDLGATLLNGMESTGSQPVVELQDIDRIRLTLQLPATDASNVEVGSQVNVMFPAISDESIAAKISRSANTLDPQSKTMKVEIDLDNKDRKIKPGMYAKVRLNAISRKGKVSVPIAAVKMVDDIPHILVVENNVVKTLPLNKGLEGRDFIEVLNNNVTLSAQVVIQGKNLVKDGQTVEASLIE